jgi:hypothetical protein
LINHAVPLVSSGDASANAFWAACRPARKRKNCLASGISLQFPWGLDLGAFSFDNCSDPADANIAGETPVWCDMEVEYAFLAKFIDMAPDGLFSVHGGGVAALAADQFPFEVPTLFLLVRLKASAEELKGEHRAQFTLTGPNGQELPFVLESPLRPRGQEVAQDYYEDGLWRMNLTIGLINYGFPEPGRYTFHVRVDGREITNVAVTVLEKPAEAKS